MNKRLDTIDSLRGITMLSMILYHFCWDLKYINGFDMPWYGTFGSFIWQQSICWSFILISGFCLHFSRRPLRNGLLVFLCGALVTVVTVFALPEAPVFFGVLTMLGSCMLLVAGFQEIMKFQNPAIIHNNDASMKCDDAHGTKWMLFIFAVLFAVTKRINYGILGFGALSVYLPSAWYSHGGADGMGMSFLTYLGIMQNGFYSSDYFSLIPWIFLFLTGYSLYHVCKPFFSNDVFRLKLPFFAWFGRHSLIVYMLHQVVLYGISAVIMYFSHCELLRI